MRTLITFEDNRRKIKLIPESDVDTLALQALSRCNVKPEIEKNPGPHNSRTGMYDIKFLTISFKESSDDRH
jgi:hypothetical protein